MVEQTKEPLHSEEAERRRLERFLLRRSGRCIADFKLIEPGDRVMACVSGGKDSYTMLDLLERHRRRFPFRFSIVAVHLDQGHPGHDGRPLEEWLKANGFEYHIAHVNTYSVVIEKLGHSRPDGRPQTYCSLCSRLRRGILYTLASELGCTKIALGHHREDSIETLLLNLIFTGSLKAMPPKLRSDDGRHIVIRPLLYCPEADIQEYARLSRFPILPCDLCGSQEHLMRKRVKALIREIESFAPRARESMLSALRNVRRTHLLDPKIAPPGSVLAEVAEMEAEGYGIFEESSEEEAKRAKRLPVLGVAQGKEGADAPAKKASHLAGGSF
ncbi:MAG: tRNA 2-thiocytidine(32) synthetase TtcA [Sandaracinaceae bacterium]|nr:tRNA 2-thiocytidine(32) synthetase TtcA [Sandaracinaceae bacterium]